MRDDETVNEFPPLPLMQRFLDLCEEYGSERLAVRLVVVGRSTGLLTLPASDDWTTWTADEMREAVEYLERHRVR